MKKKAQTTKAQAVEYASKQYIAVRQFLGRKSIIGEITESLGNSPQEMFAQLSRPAGCDLEI